MYTFDLSGNRIVIYSPNDLVDFRKDLLTRSQHQEIILPRDQVAALRRVAMENGIGFFNDALFFCNKYFTEIVISDYIFGKRSEFAITAEYLPNQVLNKQVPEFLRYVELVFIALGWNITINYNDSDIILANETEFPFTSDQIDLEIKARLDVLTGLALQIIHREMVTDRNNKFSKKDLGFEFEASEYYKEFIEKIRLLLPDWNIILSEADNHIEFEKKTDTL